MPSTALQQMKHERHISASQIFTYLGCSLKYKFMYVEQRPQEHLSVALPFGKAIHLGIERYYQSIIETGEIVPLEVMEDLFTESITLAIDNSNVPILYKKEAPDRDSVIEMGKKLLAVFCENIDITGMEVVGTEIPLSARLFTEHGEPTDFKLIGVLDLLLKDRKSEELLIVDNKTSKQKKSQDTVDSDLQMSAYSYLLAGNGSIFPRSPVNCRFDVLRKLKTPKMEHYYTVRTAEDRRRFFKIATAVLAGIESRIFIPVKSWMCFDCQYTEPCADW